MNEKLFLDFKPGEKDCGILYTWWKKLEHNKGDRAELKRCGELSEIALLPAYHHVRMLLADKFIIPNKNENALCAVIGILAGLKNESVIFSAAELFAEKKGESAKVSGLRFRRLLKCKTQQELFTSLRRILKLVDSTANPISIAHDIYNWGETIKKKWAFDYYSKASNEK